MNLEMFPTPMSRRALLIFADDARLDLARRRLPVAALPLLPTPAFEGAADVHLFDSRAQHGRTFAERFENAIETLSALGYQEIVAVGRDCPDLSANDIAQAFAQLRGKRLVLGPDHRGGCYLIAFRSADRALLRGIRWKRNTDCAELMARASGQVSLLAMKHDIDSWADVRLVARTDNAMARLATFLLATMNAVSQQIAPFVHAAVRFIRVRGQMPPPARVLA